MLTLENPNCCDQILWRLAWNRQSAYLQLNYDKCLEGVLENKAQRPDQLGPMTVRNK